jgi:pimeloyl-ACP methyl ester carboxylesterase
MTLAQLRETYPRQTIDAGGTPVEIVRTRGTGPALLLLPGAQGTAESFYRQLLTFGPQRDMLSINYPGLDDMSRLADLMIAVADAQGIGRFDIVGSSLGGYVAQWVAARHPDRVDRLVVGNSFHDPRPSQSPEKLASLVNRSAEQVKLEILERLLAAPDSEFRQVMLDLMGVQQTAAGLRSRMLAVQRAAVLEGAALDPDRLLLIECDNDPLIPPSSRQAARERFPRATVASIPGGGHYPYILKAEAYNQAIAAFLGMH